MQAGFEGLPYYHLTLFPLSKGIAIKLVDCHAKLCLVRNDVPTRQARGAAGDKAIISVQRERHLACLGFSITV
jgi:hypothetical protein